MTHFADYQSGFDLGTQWKYGVAHLREAVSSAEAGKSKNIFSRVGHLLLGIMHTVPFVGFISALVEKHIVDRTAEFKIKNREICLLREQKNRTSVLQRLYFQTFGQTQQLYDLTLNKACEDISSCRLDDDQILYVFQNLYQKVFGNETSGKETLFKQCLEAQNEQAFYALWKNAQGEDRIQLVPLYKQLQFLKSRHRNFEPNFQEPTPEVIRKNNVIIEQATMLLVSRAIVTMGRVRTKEQTEKLINFMEVVVAASAHGRLSWESLKTAYSTIFGKEMDEDLIEKWERVVGPNAITVLPFFGNQILERVRQELEKQTLPIVRGCEADEAEVLGYGSPDVMLFRMLSEVQAFQQTVTDLKEREELQGVLGKLEKAKPLYLKVGLLLLETNEKRKENLRNQLAQGCFQRVQGLNVGESCILPGGYSNASAYGLDTEAAGHALVYEVTKTAEDAFTFKIVNSGQGHDAHSYQKDQNDRVKYASVYVKNIAKEDLSEDFFQKLTKLAVLRNDEKNSIEKVYTLVRSLSKAYYLIADTDYHVDQGSVDSCSYQSINRWVKTKIRKPLYHRLQEHTLQDVLRAEEAFGKPSSTKVERSLAKYGFAKNKAAPAVVTWAIGFFTDDRVRASLSSNAIIAIRKVAEAKLRRLQAKIAKEAPPPANAPISQSGLSST